MRLSAPKRALRFAAAPLSLLAALQLGSRELLAHAHGLEETDLVAHSIAELDVPHAPAPHQPVHFEAGHTGAHAACFDCLLQALAPELSSGGAALAIETGSSTPFLSRFAPAPFDRDSEAATPRGPPSAA